MRGLYRALIGRTRREKRSSLANPASVVTMTDVPVIGTFRVDAWNSELRHGFHLGNWLVRPDHCAIEGPSGTQHLEPKNMEVLLFLAVKQGEVVRREQLVKEVWRTVVNDEVLTRAISLLRSHLGDDPKSPRYILTVPKLGYRLIPEPILLPRAVPSAGQAHAVDPAGRLLADHSRNSPQHTAGIPPWWREQRRALQLFGLLGVGLACAIAYATFREQTGAAAAAPERSIAVLPFVNLSGDPNQEYLSDGMSEELINLLARMPELRVVARTSSFAFKGENVEISEITSRLNVAHVLEGSVRKSGNTVRISTQLIRAADGTHLWSETYDRPMGDVIAVQDEVAAAVVAQLGATLTGTESRAAQPDPRAHLLYLQALNAGRSQTSEGLDLACDLIAQALAIDPAYAAAWVELGRCHIYQAGDGHGEAGGPRAPEEAYRLAREATIKALAINPENVEVYDNLATIAMHFDGDLAAAARYYEHALSLEPGNPQILGNSADLAKALGRLDLAVALGEHWVARDPMNPGSHAALGNVYAAVGRFDEAIACWRSMEAQIAPYPADGLQAAIGMALLLKGDLDGALGAIQREQSEIARVTTLPMIYHALGRHEESDAALAVLIADYGDKIPTVVASQLAFRGEADRAFEWLERAKESHHSSLLGIAGNPLLANLHGDARWTPLLLSLGRAPEQLSEIAFEVTLPPYGG